jgi:hypothetical protein
MISGAYVESRISIWYAIVVVRPCFSKFDPLQSPMKNETFSKKLVSKKVLIPAILGVGLLATVFVLAPPLENSWAQQQQQRQQRGMNITTDAFQYGEIPKINGSVNVRDGIKNFFAENAKTPFITGAQTAQDQIANGTVLGGHIGVTQGYLTYTYFVSNPTKLNHYKLDSIINLNIRLFASIYLWI